MDLSYQGFMADAVKAFELVGVAILIVGSAIGFAGYGHALLRGVPRPKAFPQPPC